MIFTIRILRREGLVSVWLGLEADDEEDGGVDVLHDLCGVGYYDLDNQEVACYDFKLLSIKDLFKEISYNKSFVDQVIQAAEQKNIRKARWAIIQYDFAYKPDQIEREIAKDPVFIGFFSYNKD